jgi:hypothetical protein
MLQLDAEMDASGFLEYVRWPLKPLEPLATQIQEPKVIIVPSSSMVRPCGVDVMVRPR